MKVLHIIGELKIGGVELSVLQFLKFCNNDTVTNFLVAKSGDESFLDGIDVKYFNIDTATENPLKIIWNGIKIARLVKKYDIDIVHAYNRNTAWSAYIASKFCRAKFVTTISGVYNLSTWLRRLFCKSLLLGDKTIATSKYVKQHFKKYYNFIPFGKIDVIYEGVDISGFDRKNIPSDITVPKDIPVIVMLSRFSKIKGHELLLNALSLLKEKYICYIIGPMPKKSVKYISQLDKQIKDKKLKVRLLDESYKSIILDADIVVCPSIRAESFGRVAVEAGLLKKIVIAANEGGHSEIINNRKTGFLFFNNNHNELATLLKDVINMDKSERQSISDAAYDFLSDRFTITRHVESKINFYLSLIK